MNTLRKLGEQADNAAINWYRIDVPVIMEVLACVMLVAVVGFFVSLIRSKKAA